MDARTRSDGCCSWPLSYLQQCSKREKLVDQLGQKKFGGNFRGSVRSARLQRPQRPQSSEPSEVQPALRPLGLGLGGLGWCGLVDSVNTDGLQLKD
jgi:hypothetical protein